MKRQPKSELAWCAVDDDGDLVAMTCRFVRKHAINSGWNGWPVVRVRIVPVVKKRKVRK